MAKAKSVSEHAKALSRLGASKGGRARADKLPPEERSIIAQKAADKRWGTPKATHEGVLEIGEAKISCAVLEDGTRLLSETAIINSLGAYRSGAVHVRARDSSDGAQLPLFLAHKNLKPFVDEVFGDVHIEPIWYRPVSGGTRHKGLDATLLPKVCPKSSLCSQFFHSSL